MSEITLVYVLFPDVEGARAASRALVTERLAACANILGPCLSIYEWDGATKEAAEIPTLFKTNAELAPALIARIAELHSYDVPAILSWPSGAVHGPFAEWVRTQVTS